MELHICGRNDGAVVLLLGGAGIDADALLSRMPMRMASRFSALTPALTHSSSTL